MDGQLFQEYSDLISLDFGTPVQTQSDLACLWEQVSEVYRKKRGFSEIRTVVFLAFLLRRTTKGIPDYQNASHA